MAKQTRQLPPGILARGDSLRIWFYWNKKRHYEPIPGKATPAAIQRAARLRGEIVSLIDLGTFTLDDYRKLFPNSIHVKQLGNHLQFGVLAQQWVDSVEVSDATRDEYKKALNKYWMPAFATRNVDTIRYSEIKKAVTDIAWSSAKTRNNCLIPLRGVFELAHQDELIERNPLDKILNQKHQKSPPDPFTREEMERILGWMTSAFQGLEEIYTAYFEFAFWTGMRTSEILGLQWGDIDLAAGYARVQRAQSKGRLNDRTKTATVRDVLLNERAVAALQRVKPLTFLAGGRIFTSPRTGQPLETTKMPLKVMTAVLRKLGIRHRPAYNTRHTYATLLLMAGANPAFVAQQLGHSLVMLLTTYAKWLKSDADQEEMAKLNTTRALT